MLSLSSSTPYCYTAHSHTRHHSRDGICSLREGGREGVGERRGREDESSSVRLNSDVRIEANIHLSSINLLPHKHHGTCPLRELGRKRREGEREGGKHLRAVSYEETYMYQVKELRLTLEGRALLTALYLFCLPFRDVF